MKVIFSLPTPLPLTSFCFVFSVAPSPPSDAWNSWLLFSSCSLKNWLAYCGAFTWPGGQWQRLLFAGLSPVFHSLLFLNPRSGTVLKASIHSPNHFVLPAAISFTRRWAFFVFKPKVGPCDRLTKGLNYLIKRGPAIQFLCRSLVYNLHWCTDEI